MRAQSRVGAHATRVAIALVLVLTGGGCTRHPGSPAGDQAANGTPPVSLPVDSALDYADASAVCLHFAEALYRRDTAADTGVQDAYRRATAYTTGELTATVAAEPARQDAQWATWRAHRAATDPTTAAVRVEDGQPADGPTDAYRAAQVGFTPLGADGWRGPDETHLVYCTLRRDRDQWRVAGYDIADLIQEADGGPGAS